MSLNISVVILGNNICVKVLAVTLNAHVFELEAWFINTVHPVNIGSGVCEGVLVIVAVLVGSTVFVGVLVTVLVGVAVFVGVGLGHEPQENWPPPQPTHNVLIGTD
jgi:hypothetical protein